MAWHMGFGESYGCEGEEKRKKEKSVALTNILLPSPTTGSSIVYRLPNCLFVSNLGISLPLNRRDTTTRLGFYLERLS